MKGVKHATKQAVDAKLKVNNVSDVGGECSIILCPV